MNYNDLTLKQSKNDKNISEELNDWVDALENLILFNGREDASDLIKNFVKHAENKGLLDSSFANLPFENSISQFEEIDIQVIGKLKKESGTLSDGML